MRPLSFPFETRHRYASDGRRYFAICLGVPVFYSVNLSLNLLLRQLSSSLSRCYYPCHASYDQIFADASDRCCVLDGNMIFWMSCVIGIRAPARRDPIILLPCMQQPSSRRCRGKWRRGSPFVTLLYLKSCKHMAH